MRSYRNVNNSLHYIHLFPNKSSIKDPIYSIFYETFYYLLLFWMLCHYRNKKRKYILCQNGPIDNVDISKIRHLLFSIFINLNKRNSYLVIRNWCNVHWLSNNRENQESSRCSFLRLVILMETYYNVEWNGHLHDIVHL